MCRYVSGVLNGWHPHRPSPADSMTSCWSTIHCLRGAVRLQRWSWNGTADPDCPLSCSRIKEGCTYTVSAHVMKHCWKLPRSRPANLTLQVRYRTTSGSVSGRCIIRRLQSLTFSRLMMALRPWCACCRFRVWRRYSGGAECGGRAAAAIAGFCGMLHGCSLECVHRGPNWLPVSGVPCLDGA